MEDGARRGALFRLSLTAPLGTSACGVRPRVVPTVQRKGVHTTSHGVFGFALASRTHTQLGTSKRFSSMRRTHHADAAGRRSRQWSRQARGRHMNRFEHHSKHLQTHMGGSRFFLYVFAVHRRARLAFSRWAAASWCHWLSFLSR